MDFFRIKNLNCYFYNNVIIKNSINQNVLAGVLVFICTNALADESELYIEDRTYIADSATISINSANDNSIDNYVYYPMFSFSKQGRWLGNVKKYKIIEGKQFGRKGKSLFNLSTGDINDDVLDYWFSDEQVGGEGNKLYQGGVATMLRNKTDRKLLIEGQCAGSLCDFNRNNIERLYGNNKTLASNNLANELGVEEKDIDKILLWAQGVNTEQLYIQDSIPQNRPGIFADPMHSKPFIINYGTNNNNNNNNNNNTNTYMVIGTNAGVLHMFHDQGSSVDETWAFMPKAFLKNIKALKNVNLNSANKIDDKTGSMTVKKSLENKDKIYGIDGHITSHITDHNHDGMVNDSDQVLLFFGLRRGGRSYYAMDITLPHQPKLLWHINNETSGFSELGQSWSKAKVVYSSLNIMQGRPKPALIFSGGYDTNKDKSGVGSKDNMGRAIYMVDAESGRLLWSMAPSKASTTFHGKHSIAASVATLDSNSDGLIDRLYAADTGGAVWRIDMPIKSINGVLKQSRVIKLASLGGTSGVTDRRFFNEPSIVRTLISEAVKMTNTVNEQSTAPSTAPSTPPSTARNNVVTYQEKATDVIVVGSGDLAKLFIQDNVDRLFVLKDRNIHHPSVTNNNESAYPSVIKIEQLYDYSDLPYEQPLSTAQKSRVDIAVSKKSGWYMDLADTGEKTSSLALVINGTIYFNSVTANSISSNEVAADSSAVKNYHCINATTATVNNNESRGGQSWLYSIDLLTGLPVDFSPHNLSDTTCDKRKLLLGEGISSEPNLIMFAEKKEEANSTEANSIQAKLMVGKKIIAINFSLKTMRTYLYVSEE